MPENDEEKAESRAQGKAWSKPLVALLVLACFLGMGAVAKILGAGSFAEVSAPRSAEGSRLVIMEFSDYL